jgi:L-asparagine oxygenase
MNCVSIDQRSLAKYGYARFSCNSKFQSTIEVARSVGEVVVPQGVPLVQTLTPSRVEDKEASSYSGNYGMEEFPLHTDMAHWYVPPPYLLLRCIQPAEHVYTTVVSIRAIVGAEDPEIFKRALFRPRRRLDGRLSILRLYDRGIFRWDQLFVLPINSRAIELQARIAALIENEEVARVCYESTTDCVLVDNRNAVHGRSSVPRFAASRVLERVFLSRLNR